MQRNAQHVAWAHWEGFGFTRTMVTHLRAG
jgi:hypothetical protein